MTSELIRAASAYVERLDFRLVVADSKKQPAGRFFPRGVLSATQDLGLLERAIRATPGATLAVRVGSYLVLDVDVRHGGIEALARLPPMPATWMQETPTGGLHIWFRGVSLAEARGFLWKGATGKAIEVLRGNRLVTLAPSERLGGRYRWIQRPSVTPLAGTPRWIVDAIRVHPVVEPELSVEVPPERRLERARAYLERFGQAHSGQGGHDRTFLACSYVLRGFQVEEQDALSLLVDWNRNNHPPWSESELGRKLKEARRAGRMAWGCMLTEKVRAA